MVPLKYLCSFWRTLEVILKWPRKCIRVAGTANNRNPSIQVNDIMFMFLLYFYQVKKIKLLKKLESGFKRTISWKKYLAKTTN